MVNKGADSSIIQGVSSKTQIYTYFRLKYKAGAKYNIGPPVALFYTIIGENAMVSPPPSSFASAFS